MRYRLLVEYLGTGFAGWQVQPGARTVQGELERAISTVVRAPVRLVGASRTDAGVHAAGQVAHLDLEGPVDASRLLRGANALAGPDIAVVSVDEAPPGFHARYSARGKRYVYRILARSAPSPLLREISWHLPVPLDLSAMREAAACLVGRRNFSAFAKAGGPPRDPVRDLRELTLERRGDLVLVRMVADAFLYGMARAIVGTLVEVGRGRMSPARVLDILEGGERSAAGPAAPARGLCLEEVLYETGG